MTARTTAATDLRTLRRVAVLALLTILAAMLGVVLPSQAAHATGTVVITPEPSADGETRVTISGSGFQYVPNAPGGIYVFFGVVSDPSSNAWAPSQGGASGTTYSYASTEGSILLVAFEGGSSASEAGALIDANGNWSAEFTIPGSSFTLSSGNPHGGEAQEGETVDCLQQTCGIITIGAHGNVNANNESFTPVTFAAAEEPAEPVPTENPEPTATTAPSTDADADAQADEESLGFLGGTDVGTVVLIAAGALVAIGVVLWIVVAARRTRTSDKDSAAGMSSPDESDESDQE